jgi:hypothetical protein
MSWSRGSFAGSSAEPKQCLDRRIPDLVTLECEVAAWESSRNKAKAKIDWQFTTHDARIKLKTLYPSIQV